MPGAVGCGGKGSAASTHASRSYRSDDTDADGNAAALQLDCRGGWGRCEGIVRGQRGGALMTRCRVGARGL
eukprot:827771-Prorocentrum_minimum.AAC.1